MKKITLKNALSIAGFFLFSAAIAQPTGFVEFKPTGAGREGNASYSITSTINIDATGLPTVAANTTPASYAGTFDWTISAASGTTGGVDTFGAAIGGAATSQSFDITTKAAAVFSLVDDATFGTIATLTTTGGGGIDRATGGAFGVRGLRGTTVSSSNGIDTSEGMIFGINATNLSPSYTVQITEINISTAASMVEYVSFIKTSAAAPKPRVVFTPASGAAGFAPLNSINLYVTGGTSVEDLVSCVNSSAAEQNLRIDTIRLRIIPTSSLSVSDLENAFSNSIVVNQNRAAGTVSVQVNNSDKAISVSLIDANGKTIESKISNSSSLSFNTGSLASGVYFVKVSNGVSTVTKKIVK